MARLANSKHELYCHYRACGDTQADSYMRAYGKAEGEVQRNTRAQQGYDLEKDPIIKNRINEIKDWNAAKLAVTREMVAHKLIDLMSNAELQTCQADAAKALNKMMGFNEADKVDLAIGESTGQKTFADLFSDDEEKE